MYDNPLSYEYINSFTNQELYDLEELCISVQDTLSLQRIQRVRGWRNPANRTSPQKFTFKGFPENCI